MGSRIISGLRRARRYYAQILRSRSPRLVYVGGWLGHDNLGDEALWHAYRRIFDTHSLVHYPSAGGSALSVPHRFLRIADAAVLAGGTLINRESYLPAVRECTKNIRPCFVLGTGVADPAFWRNWSQWKDTLDQWRPLLKRCTYIGVRGPRSAEVLADIGIDAEVVGDPVLALCDDASVAPEQLLPRSIGLNIGGPSDRMWGDRETIGREAARLAARARQAGWNVRWFVVWPNDKEATLQAAHDSGTEAEVYEIYDDADRYLDLVRPLSVFVGMKLHAVVLATCAFVPSIMLEYQPKCRDYMRAIEQQDCTVRTDRFDGGQVWDLVQDLHGKRHQVSLALCERVHALRDSLFRRAAQVVGACDPSRRAAPAGGIAR